MADRSVRRRKKKEEVDEKPSEEETAVGKHLRFNLATKTSKIGGHKAEYFTGSKAVEFLLDSKWASGEKGTKILFTDRNSVVRYLNELLYKGMFYRALKVVKKSKKEKGEEKKDKKPEKKDKKEKTKEKEKEKDKEKKDDKGSKDEKEDSGKKGKEGKRKVRLEPTDDQFFADGNDAYVWVFDPIKPMYYVYGALLVIGAIAVCLFPLWPHWMRIGTYYTSLGGAGLVGSVLVLAVFRLIIFCIVWTTTISKIHFWLFPNLLADVGILESFQPVYVCDYMSGDDKKDENEEKEEEAGKEDDSENSKADTKPEELKASEDDKNIEKQSEETISKDPEAEKESEELGEEEEENEGSSKSGGSSAENGQEGFEFIEQEEISEASQEPEESSA